MQIGRNSSIGDRDVHIEVNLPFRLGNGFTGISLRTAWTSRKDPTYLKPEIKEGVVAFLLAHPERGAYEAPGYDEDMCKYYKPYVLSIERLRNIRQIADDTNVNWSVRERFSNEVVRLNAISITYLLDLKSLGVINAETNVAVQSKAVREFLQRAKEEDERERSREKTNVPKARWIQ